ncbi:hypothetical protein SK128_007590 [Halocaridina rubra]|uniref:C2H2-type domain-containing protein n=1 Tax=Halocaridina rubra TaxID=373956 RepID=A0AAN9ACB3_HALRR
MSFSEALHGLEILHSLYLWACISLEKERLTTKIGVITSSDIGIVTGPRSGICEKHFMPQDIRKGKMSSLNSRAIPIPAKSYEVNSGIDIPIKSPVRSEKDDDQVTVESYSYENDWKNHAGSIENVFHPVCIESNNDYYIVNGKTCPQVQEKLVQNNYKEIIEVNICLVCGKNCKNLLLMYNIQSQIDNSTSANVGLLSRIVGKPKREIFVASVKICSRCLYLIQEVSHIEESLKAKKQTIKDMFFNTLQNYNQKQQEAKPSSFASTSVSIVDANINKNVPNADEDEPPETRLCDTKRSSSRRHITSKKYYCPTCKEVYPSLALWVQHCSKHTDNEDIVINDKAKFHKKETKRKILGLYNCVECNKTFNSKQSLIAHAPAHQKGTECNVCGRFLSSRARLKAHLLKMHDIGEEKSKEVECSDCGKCFTTKAGLRYHRNVIHHVGTKYICEQCNKVFYYHVPYNSHMLYAHGEKKVICETCGEKFFTVSKLNAHINSIHRSAKSWACKECKSKFTTHTAYRHHMNVKHLKVQHACEYCNARFRKKSSLVAHLWKHSVFVCQVCKKNFASSDDLRTHMSEVHGKDISWKGRKKQSSQVIQKEQIEPTTESKENRDESLQQNERVTSIVINDLLITAESYDNSSLQPFSLSACEKLPEKQGYSSGEEMKGEAMNIIDSTADLQAVDPAQFDTVGTLQIKTAHDHIDMTPGVSLINVQILGDMEISQSDSLGDLKNSMLHDTGDHMSHDEQLETEDNMNNHLNVETHHLTTEELSVGNELEPACHTLDQNNHLATACHFDSATHLEVTHRLDASSQLHAERRNRLKIARCLETETHLANLKGITNLDRRKAESSNRCLQNSSTADPKTLTVQAHIEGSENESHGSLETNDHCSLPSIISNIDSQGSEEEISQFSPHIQDITSGVDAEIVPHIGSDMGSITSEVGVQMVDSATHHKTNHIHEEIDHLAANVKAQIKHPPPKVDTQMSNISGNVNSQIVKETEVNIGSHVATEISDIASDVSARIVDHAEVSMGGSMDARMLQQDEDIVSEALDKQLEKIDSVELEPFSVALDQQDVQYQYVMYISASGDESNPD